MSIEVGQVEMPQGLLFLSKTQPFFLTKCFSNCCKILVNFQSSEKIDFDNFYLCYCFYKRADSQISLPCIPADVLFMVS